MRIPFENSHAIAGYVNKKNPIEIRTLDNGRSTIELQIATKYSYKVNNEWKDEDEWHTVVAYGNDAEALKAVVDKSSRTLFLRVVGRKRTRRWTGADQKQRHRIELIVESFAEIVVHEQTQSPAGSPLHDEDTPLADAFKRFG